MTRFPPNGLQAYTAISATGRYGFTADDDLEAEVICLHWKPPIKLYRGDISIADAPNHTPIREIG